MAKVETINSLKLLTAEQAREKILRSVGDDTVSAELQRWLAHSRTHSASTLYALNPEQLALFLDKLQDLLLAMYCQHQEDRKGGDNEH